jgi:hypothetical protein
VAERVWRLTHDAMVRSDAPGLFVPADELATATPGDLVIVTGETTGEVWEGEFAEVVDDERGRFARLEARPG